MVVIKEVRLIEKIDLNIARKISINQAKEYEIIPLYEDGDNVYVAASYDNNSGEDLLRFLLKKNIVYIRRSKKEVLDLINIILDYDYENYEEKIFREAIQSKASDIHFELFQGILNVRFRINSSLILFRKLKAEEYLQIASRLKVKAKLDITEKRRPQDGKLYIDLDGEIYNCRLSTIPVVGGEKLVLRIMYGEKFLKDISELNFSVEQQKILRQIIKLKNGLVIFNGPTGSGKSTTLYTILNMIKGEAINITTLEDPIEVTMPGINQVNLNPKIGLNFAEGLRSVLRQDPDVIMIGEIRDEETAKMAVRSSITGHKVYSTIHTKSPREVYLRLEDMGIKDYLIREALVGIVSQRLVRILCNKCKEKVGHKIIYDKEVDLYKKVGCISCNKTGYSGRTLVASVNYIGFKTKNTLKDIYNREDILSNKQMIDGLNKLIIDGKVDYNDYLEFIEGEELTCGGNIKV